MLRLNPNATIPRSQSCPPKVRRNVMPVTPSRSVQNDLVKRQKPAPERKLDRQI